jgi:hypothetical protein
VSICKTLDVFCDFPGCLAWAHGVSGNRVSASAARFTARRNERFVSRRIAGNPYDLCPSHSEATYDDIALAKIAHDRDAIPGDALDGGESMHISEVPLSE